jgi:hypothetical protein
VSDRRHRLPKDVGSIMRGAALPEDVARCCASYPPPPPALTQTGPRVVAFRDARVRVDLPTPSPRPVRDVRIEALMETVTCPRNHVCYRSGLQTLCRVRPLLGGCVMECIEQGPPCSHRLSILRKALCRCAIRRYIARTFGR